MSDSQLFKLNRIIKLALIKIGFRCDLVGFSYLCRAVELVVLDPSLVHKLCKGLYTQVADSFKGKTEGSIERSIRHSIENTYLNKSFAELNRMFKTQLYTIDDKPTVGELIRLLAEYYNLGLYKEHLGIDD